MSEDRVVQLAPNHKVGLALRNPVMPAAGCFGLGTEYAHLVDVETLGAIVVGPVTAQPRRGANPPRTVPVPGGVLLHTGLANPGVAAVVRRYARKWARSPVPVIVHVAGTSPDEAAACCRRLSGVETVSGIELGLPDTASGSAGPTDVDLVDDAVAIIQAARADTSPPLIVRLPLSSALALCEAAVEAGADALTVAAPPRGSDWHVPGACFVTGRLYGPFVLPLALRALRQVAKLVPVPLVGCGGIHDVEDTTAFLQAGATAVQVSGGLWHDPACLARIACSLPSPAASQ
jgi:dihydroorotate dehydrogenase (NAD+) catalytic subunit